MDTAWLFKDGSSSTAIGKSHEELQVLISNSRSKVATATLLHSLVDFPIFPMVFVLVFLDVTCDLVLKRLKRTLRVRGGPIAPLKPLKKRYSHLKLEQVPTLSNKSPILHFQTSTNMFKGRA